MDHKKSRSRMKLSIAGAVAGVSFLFLPAAVAPIRTARAQSPSAADPCPLFPANNIWNARVDTLPVHSLSTQWIDTIGRTTGFHPDFGSGTYDGGPIGIPFNIVDAGVPKVSVAFHYAGESDAGPYPIPTNPLIEYGSDRHLLIKDRSSCKLYEIYDASYSGGWHGGSGAIWDLNSNALRPAGWTSADAAGLPILPGLVQYDEIAQGAINHAIRFTTEQTNGYIWPARHLTSDDPGSPQIPPMGARFRLKASFDISGYPPVLQIILRAMKKYGIILADNGSSWFIGGAPDERWDNDILHQIGSVTGDDFEAVDESGLMVDPNSGEARFLTLPDAFAKSSPANAANANTAPTLTWAASSGAASYDYCVDTTNNNSCDTSWVSAGISTSAALSGLTKNTIYYWQVRAINTKGTTYADGGIWWSFTAKNQTFADVPVDYWAWSYIERLYAAGITGGCGTGPLIFCPDASVTRAQMAIFLERGMRGASYTPPAGTGTVFGDVGLSYYADSWIEKLYADGVTGGCASSPLRYCPDTAVTRDGMAIFLLRAKHGSSYAPPATTGVFADVPASYWDAAWIEQLYHEGITGGCSTSPLNYCPGAAVTRAQMAIFLVKAFSLP